MKSKECSECQHLNIGAFYVKCGKDHKPRFYNDPDPHKSSLRRRCNDFKAKGAGE